METRIPTGEGRLYDTCGMLAGAEGAMVQRTASTMFGLAAVMLFGHSSASWAKGASADPSRAATRGVRSGIYGPGNVYENVPPRDEYGRDQLAMFRAWNPDPIGNHHAGLEDLDPRLVAVVRRVQNGDPGLRFVIGSGRRTVQLQRMAWAWGWSKTRTSRHRIGTAVDLWPLDAQGHVAFERDAQNRLGAAIMRAAKDTGVRIRWGGDFQGYKDHDRSHFEIKE